MNEPATNDLPLWAPRPDLNAADLANTLEHIRRAAYMHWWGDAFEPKHMRDIANAAAQALCGEPIPAPVDMNSPQWHEQVQERTEVWQELCGDEVARIGAGADDV